MWPIYPQTVKYINYYNNYVDDEKRNHNENDNSNKKNSNKLLNRMDEVAFKLFDPNVTVHSLKKFFDISDSKKFWQFARTLSEVTLGHHYSVPECDKKAMLIDADAITQRKQQDFAENGPALPIDGDLSQLQAINDSIKQMENSVKSAKISETRNAARQERQLYQKQFTAFKNVASNPYGPIIWQFVSFFNNHHSKFAHKVNILTLQYVRIFEKMLLEVSKVALQLRPENGNIARVATKTANPNTKHQQDKDNEQRLVLPNKNNGDIDQNKDEIMTTTANDDEDDTSDLNEYGKLFTQYKTCNSNNSKAAIVILINFVQHYIKQQGDCIQFNKKENNEDQVNTFLTLFSKSFANKSVGNGRMYEKLSMEKRLVVLLKTVKTHIYV